MAVLSERPSFWHSYENLTSMAKHFIVHRHRFVMTCQGDNSLQFTVEFESFWYILTAASGLGWQHAAHSPCVAALIKRKADGIDVTRESQEERLADCIETYLVLFSLPVKMAMCHFCPRVRKRTQTCKLVRPDGPDLPNYHSSFEHVIHSTTPSLHSQCIKFYSCVAKTLSVQGQKWHTSCSTLLGKDSNQ